MFSNSSKLANKTAVQQAAEYLILSNGQTTTLEVKRYLREQGFEVYQSDVSRWMNRLSQELDWEYTFNGRNRTYGYRLDDDFNPNEGQGYWFSLN